MCGDNHRFSRRLLFTSLVKAASINNVMPRGQCLSSNSVHNSIMFHVSITTHCIRVSSAAIVCMTMYIHCAYGIQVHGYPSIIRGR